MLPGQKKKSNKLKSKVQSTLRHELCQVPCIGCQGFSLHKDKYQVRTSEFWNLIHALFTKLCIMVQTYAHQRVVFSKSHKSALYESWNPELRSCLHLGWLMRHYSTYLKLPLCFSTFKIWTKIFTTLVVRRFKLNKIRKNVYIVSTT